MGIGNHDDQPGKRTNDQRIDQRTYHCHRAFPNRFFGFGCCVGNRCASLASFVGEQPAFYSPHHGIEEDHKTAAANPQKFRSGRKCLGENFSESRQNLIIIHDNNEEGGHHINNGHARRQPGCNLPDPFDAAQNNQRYQRGGNHC